LTNTPLEEMTREEILSVTAEVKRLMQEGLHAADKAYGQSPYRLRRFFAAVLTKSKNFPYELPFAWPLLFSAFRQHYKGKESRNEKIKLGFLSWLRVLWKNPFDLFFYIPILGWIPLLLKGAPKREKKL
jgi:hypothetical protein